MKLKVFRSGPGDCLLLTSPGGTRILADAGVPDAYSDYVAATLGALRDKGFGLDLLYVSHIDRDHIGGVLRMLDIETEWLVFDHMRAKGKKWKRPASARPPKVSKIWHNALFDDLQKSTDVEFDPMGLSQLLGSAASALAAAQLAGKSAQAQLLALSVGDAIEVNWRIGKEQLDIPLNPEFDGELMMRGGPDLQVGDVDITVIAPSPEELEVFRTDWVKWLKTNKDYIEKLRKQHRRDIDRLDSADAAQVIAEARRLALEVEKDVTPPNLASLVLLARCGGRSILLTGDAGDETILGALEQAGLLDAERAIKVDVLKVPHHGAHNSFSPDFARRVRADHYIFCGDGEHDNPEHEVVEGYIAARSALSGSFTLHFNCSSALATRDHVEHWDKLEKIVRDANAGNKRVKYRMLTSGVSFDLTLN